ncbi:wd-40 repeat-containing protein [Leptolyngbya sp. Heron Island J]|uniref:P-loop NTPase fold protein n=1 Tax=Leptolyngbya sp. Heron Island J TaxID=1385935 RepID=UPI0003B9E49E|nr:P-loop NTPase fold protein [Leptolyngbya sp. Heron Island J]ESA39127.1 wd-40 repeat-containing protein [Leptolyngbya sp. Heron Island J]
MIRIFLAHANEDKDAVIDLYNRLKERGFEPWLDKVDLLPGQSWRVEIPKAIKNSQVFIACLSQKSVQKQGYLLREFKIALNEMADRPAGEIYLIPLRLDDCRIPELRQEEYGIQLSDFQWVNLFEPDGFERLVQGIEAGFPNTSHFKNVAGTSTTVTNLIPQSIKNDVAEGKDLLDIAPEVNALAEVLGMRVLTPPLAVGILGGWGSGKSFVMHLMRQSLNAIYQEAISTEQAWALNDNDNPDAVSPYVGHIYQIYFNSWTYAKADIWSSLMQNIFYELNYQLTIEKHLRDTFALHAIVTELKLFQAIDSDEMKTSIEELVEIYKEEDFNWDAFESGIGKKLSITREKFRDIWFKAQESARIRLCEGGKILNVVSNNLTVREQGAAIEAVLGKQGLIVWQKLISHSRTQGVIWDELTKLRENDQKELASIEKRLLIAEQDLERQTKITKLSTRRKLEQRKLTIVWQPLLIRGYELLGIEPDQIDSWKTLLNTLRCSPRTYIALFCLTAFIVVGASPSWSERMAAFQSVIQAYFNISKIWLMERYTTYWPLSLPITGALLQKIWTSLKQYLNEVKQAQVQLRGKYEEWLLEEKDKRNISRLSQEVEGLRLQVEEKRRQVGLIANRASLLGFINNRVQEDSYGQRLNIIHQIKYDLDRLSQHLVYQDKDLSSGQGHDARKLFPRGPARVILYIDDLDRCPPDRVVDVLEAVQLLINTPLFVVVLSVDDRYITRALENVYKGILKRHGSPCGLDYLEKIIQIPYRTRPISSDGIDIYLESQMEIDEEENSLENKLQPRLVKPSSEPLNLKASSEPVSSAKKTEHPPPQVAKFTPAELQTLKEYCREVDLTPRTIKRLINIYKILKILWFRLKSEDQETSEDVKKSVLAMLVLSGKYPSFMREVLAEMAHYYGEQNAGKTEQYKTLKTCFEECLKQLDDTKDSYLERELRKFSRAFEAIIPKSLTLHEIEKKNFNLVLSFCFVGDIGYDPEDYHLDEEFE